MAIWAPVLLLVLSVVIFGGRMVQSGLTVESAAGEAARAATAADSRAQAVVRARAAAEAALNSAGLRCDSVSVAVDTTQWSRPPGQPARATATVSCRVTLSDLAAGTPIPGSRLVSSSASSALDTYRVRD
jgi:Flp pilus assembly protein TadG